MRNLLLRQSFFTLSDEINRTALSESNYFNDTWQQAFWGNNYQKLRDVKTKYDPDGLFFVYHGVGSEAWSSDGFTRLA